MSPSSDPVKPTVTGFLDSWIPGFVWASMETLYALVPVFIPVSGHYAIVPLHRKCREHLSNLPSHRCNATHQGIPISQLCYEEKVHGMKIYEKSPHTATRFE